MTKNLLLVYYVKLKNELVRLNYWNKFELEMKPYNNNIYIIIKYIYLVFIKKNINLILYFLCGYISFLYRLNARKIMIMIQYVFW